MTLFGFTPSSGSVFQVLFAWLSIPAAIGLTQTTLMETVGPVDRFRSPTIGEDSHFMSANEVFGNKWVAFIDTGTLKPQDGLAMPFAHSLQMDNAKTKYCVVVDLETERSTWLEVKSNDDDEFVQLSDLSPISDDLISVRRDVRKKTGVESFDQATLDFGSGLMSIQSSPTASIRSGFEWIPRMKHARIDFNENGTARVVSDDRKTRISLTGIVRPHAGFRGSNEPSMYLIPGNTYSSLYLVENQKNGPPKLDYVEFGSNTNNSSSAQRLAINIESECSKQACKYLLPAMESLHPTDATWIIANFADETSYAVKLKDGKVTYVKKLSNPSRIKWHRGSPNKRFLAIVCENESNAYESKVVMVDSQDDIELNCEASKWDGYYFNGISDTGRMVFDHPNKGLRVFELKDGEASQCFELQLFEQERGEERNNDG